MAPEYNPTLLRGLDTQNMLDVTTMKVDCYWHLDHRQHSLKQRGIRSMQYILERTMIVLRVYYGSSFTCIHGQWLGLEDNVEDETQTCADKFMLYFLSTQTDLAITAQNTTTNCWNAISSSPLIDIIFKDFLESHFLLNLRNCQTRIQSLRTCPRAVENSVTSVQTHAVIQSCLTFFLLLITGICKPSVTLQQDSWSQVLLTVPPVGGARCRAACAENTFVKSIKLLTILLRLQVFFSFWCWVGVLKIWLNGLVLLVELCQIWNNILDDIGVG